MVQDILTVYNNLNNGSSESKSSDEPPTKKAKHTDGIRKSKKRSRKSKKRSRKSKRRSTKKSKKRSRKSKRRSRKSKNY